jgi:hypothetical protein
MGSNFGELFCKCSLLTLSEMSVVNLPTAVTLRTPKNCALMHASETVGYHPKKKLPVGLLDIWTCSKMRMGQISQIAIHGSSSIQICYVSTRNHWGIPLCCPNGFAPKGAKVWWFLDEMTKISASNQWIEPSLNKMMEGHVQLDTPQGHAASNQWDEAYHRHGSWPMFHTQWPIICIRKNHLKLDKYIKWTVM